jgi:hypothetical protein
MNEFEEEFGRNRGFRRSQERRDKVVKEKREKPKVKKVFPERVPKNTRDYLEMDFDD